MFLLSTWIFFFVSGTIWNCVYSTSDAPIQTFIDSFSDIAKYRLTLVMGEGATLRFGVEKSPYKFLYYFKISVRPLYLEVEIYSPSGTALHFPRSPPCNSTHRWPRSPWRWEVGPEMFLIEVNDTREAKEFLASMEATTTQCHNEIAAGHYWAHNVVWSKHYSQKCAFRKTFSDYFPAALQK